MVPTIPRRFRRPAVFAVPALALLLVAPLALAGVTPTEPALPRVPPVVFHGRCEYASDGAVHTVRCEQDAGTPPPPPRDERGPAALRASQAPDPEGEPRPLPPGGHVSLSRGGFLTFHPRSPVNLTVVGLNGTEAFPGPMLRAGPEAPAPFDVHRFVRAHGPIDTLVVKARFADGGETRVAYSVGK